MYSNETILFITAIVCAGLVTLAWKVNRERLYSLIIVFLILISIIGAKIVVFFGHETNTGNIFYASVFLATYFLTERYGKREGFRSIWIGAAGVIAFSILLQLGVMLISVPSSSVLSDAFSMAFAPAPRLALASIVAYICSQTLNVYLYTMLKTRFELSYLWLRANISNILAQLLDSAVFFTIAFWGVIPPDNIGDIVLTGFLIKVIFVMVASPLLYLNRVQHEEGNGFASVTRW